MSRIGIIGLGLVGSALAERFLQNKFEVVGFDIDAARNDSLVQLGGRPGDSAARVVQQCERIVLSLPTSDIVCDVLTPLAINLRGKTVIDTTTGEPDAMNELGTRLAQQQCDYLVATIAGSSAQVRRGEVVAMLGGSAETVDRCEDLLQAFARQWFHVGGWRNAARMKLVVNLVLGLNRAALAEGLAFAKACSIDPQRALEVLLAGPAFSRVMETKGGKMVERDFAPEARLAQHHKDVRLILEQGKKADTDLPLSTLHESLLARLIEQGLGDADNSAIIEAFQ
jgi:3-hydroxyisobutyrate dehydrogenase-like beta-hydroxyacid dehydrogenase